MPADPGAYALLAGLVLLAAVLYSSVGHAGASGYLAAMALSGVAPDAMKPAALAMNIAVAAVGSIRFARARQVPWALVGPLVAGSVPAAYVGGTLVLPPAYFRPFLAAVLVFASLRLWQAPSMTAQPRPLPHAVLLPVIGAVLGLLSGLTGVGGGIFLSPLILFAGWEGPRRTAGASIVFILLNSIAGLLGLLASAQEIPAGTGGLALIALAGGTYGSWLGAHHLAPVALRRLLAVVLLVAGAKLVLG